MFTLLFVFENPLNVRDDHAEPVTSCTHTYEKKTSPVSTFCPQQVEGIRNIAWKKKNILSENRKVERKLNKKKTNEVGKKTYLHSRD